MKAQAVGMLLHRAGADAGLGQQGRGIGVGLIFILARQARGQKRGKRVGDVDAEAGDDARQHHAQGGAHRVLPGEIDHAAA